MLELAATQHDPAHQPPPKRRRPSASQSIDDEKAMVTQSRTVLCTDKSQLEEDSAAACSNTNITQNELNSKTVAQINATSPTSKNDNPSTITTTNLDTTATQVTTSRGPAIASVKAPTVPSTGSEPTTTAAQKTQSKWWQDLCFRCRQVVWYAFVFVDSLNGGCCNMCIHNEKKRNDR